MLAAAFTFGGGAARAADLILPAVVAATHWKTKYMNEFAAEVNKRTSGAVNVKVFPAGQLYNDRDAIAALGTGSVHMVWPVPCAWRPSIPHRHHQPGRGTARVPRRATMDARARLSLHRQHQ